MSEQLVFDYYYGKEADMFSFLRVPRLLIKDPHFRELSNDAKCSMVLCWTVCHFL